MSEAVYQKLAKVLDTLPNGFPPTETGIEIKILEKIFTPEEADLFCDLKLNYETAAQIAQRTGRSVEGLEEKLVSMWKRGEIWGIESGGVKLYKLMPWVLGIYEFQLKRMDLEFAKLYDQYSPYWGMQFMQSGPELVQIIPVEKQIPVKQEALTFQQVSALIDNAKSYAINECICKKKNGLLGKPCTRPTEVCMGLAPEPGVFENHPWGGKPITKEEALEVLRKAEEVGLVHLTNNTQSEQWFICNCCSCCCGLLNAAKMGIPNIISSHYYAQIDPEKCIACGTCAEERCQVGAIKEGEESYSVIKEKCIGCGLCATTCPQEAIELIHKKSEEIALPPKDEMAWYEEKGRKRGVDFRAYQ